MPAAERPHLVGLVTLVTVCLSGCVTELGLLDDGWTRLPPGSLSEPRPARPTESLPAEVSRVEIPPEPTLDRERSKPKRPLTLAQASLLALKNNRRIRIVSFDPKIAAQQPLLSDAAFDMRFGVGGTYSKTDTPTASQVESQGGGSTFQVDSFVPPAGLPNLLSVDKRLRSGGAFSANYGFSYDKVDNGGEFLNLNPSWRSNFTVSIEQPLVRGRGKEVNELDIRIARVNHDQSLHEFERTAQELLRDTQLAYWNLAYALLNRQSLLRSRESAEDTENSLVAQFELGRADLSDLAHGTLFAEGVAAEAARAERAIQSAEQQLRILMGLPSDDGMRLDPTEPPIADLFDPDWEGGVRAAFAKRPDLKSQATRVKSARLVMRQSAEVLRPDVAAVGNFGLAGLDDGLSDSLDDLNTGDFANWSLGVRYQQTLGRRAEKATLELAKLSLGREKATLKAIEATVISELEDSYREIATTREVVEHEIARVKAAEVFLDSRKQLHEKGLLRLANLLEARSFLTDARVELLLALVEYNQAIVSWQWATGSILGKPLGKLTKPEDDPSDALKLLMNPPPVPTIPPLPIPNIPEVDLGGLTERVGDVPDLDPLELPDPTAESAIERLFDAGPLPGEDRDAAGWEAAD